MIQIISLVQPMKIRHNQTGHKPREKIEMTTYRKVRKLDCNNNGQGVIWEGINTETGDRVAMKYMKQIPDDPDPDTSKERFLREIRCQKSLQHPNIVDVLGSGRNGTGGPFYIMDWADGSLRDTLVANPGGLPEPALLRIFTSVVEGMAYAHAEGVIHRDLKPENVLFFNGVPRLADFGLGLRMMSKSARITRSHLGFGTPEYMAPEQFNEAHAVGPAADVYSLGKLLHELLTGKVPTWFPPDINEAPGKFHYILHRCLDQDPSKRFANASELGQALALLSGPTSTLSAPDEQAKSELDKILNGDLQAVQKLAQILMENPEDSDLYLDFLPLIPGGAVIRLGAQAPTEFAQILLNFDRFAEGGHPWSFCDTLADFMASAYKATNDFATHKLLMARVLELGRSHNRWYVRGVFKEVASLALKQPGHAQVLADVLRANPPGAAFVESALRSLSLPKVVLDVLDEDVA